MIRGLERCFRLPMLCGMSPRLPKPQNTGLFVMCAKLSKCSRNTLVAKQLRICFMPATSTMHSVTIVRRMAGCMALTRRK